MSRVERLAELLARYDQAAGDYDEGEDEDPRPYLDGREECGRWCCVTVNYSSHGGAKYFFLPTFDDAATAQARAVDYPDDGAFEELPVAVVDLDTGAARVPVWRSLSWKEDA